MIVQLVQSLLFQLYIRRVSHSRSTLQPRPASLHSTLSRATENHPKEPVVS